MFIFVVVFLSRQLATSRFSNKHFFDTVSKRNETKHIEQKEILGHASGVVMKHNTLGFFSFLFKKIVSFFFRNKEKGIKANWPKKS